MTASWVLVVLTLAGGTSAPQPGLPACTNALLAIKTSRVREAYCMDTKGDRVYYVRHGRVVGLE